MNERLETMPATVTARPQPPPVPDGSLVDDQRLDPRHPASLPVAVVIEGQVQEHACHCEDVGVGGLRLRLASTVDASRLPVGAQLKLCLRLPDFEGAVEAEGIVRWIGRADARVVGVQFRSGLRAREVWAINRLRKA